MRQLCGLVLFVSFFLFVPIVVSGEEITANVKQEQEVIRLVNIIRTENGLQALKPHKKLDEVARMKAKDLVENKYFSHESPTHGSPFNMMKANGIRFQYAGENLAMGQTYALQVVIDWMNSPSHKANILHSHYEHISVIYYQNVWVQMFVTE